MEATIGSWRVTVQRIPLTKQELVGMYDRAAAHWHDSVRRLGYGRAYARLLADLGRGGELEGVSGGQVLDCGIGTGAFSVALADAGVRPARVYGIDLAPRMLEEARRVLDVAGVNAVLQRHDLRELPFEADRFSMAMCAHALEHLPDPEAGLREMVRILRPGAPLVVVATRRGVLGACLHLRWRNACFSAPALEAMAARVGLTEVRVFPLSAEPSWCRSSSLVLVGRKSARSHAAPRTTAGDRSRPRRGLAPAPPPATMQPGHPGAKAAGPPRHKGAACSGETSSGLWAPRRSA
jgi:demethylmenaquinone methyltransferase/2-methoxy-6-polyprenyl-1,4-benzoquinol methylase